MSRLALLAASALAMMATTAAAQTAAIKAARQAGTVAERFDGYLGLVGGTATLRNQVGSVNIRRRALYTQLAAQRGVTPQAVGITAGCQLLARVAVGERYVLGDGVWRRRAPGEGAPRPNYCG